MMILKSLLIHLNKINQIINKLLIKTNKINKYSNNNNIIISN